jgi:hypothetical protein
MIGRNIGILGKGNLLRQCKLVVHQTNPFPPNSITLWRFSPDRGTLMTEMEQLRLVAFKHWGPDSECPGYCLLETAYSSSLGDQKQRQYIILNDPK